MVAKESSSLVEKGERMDVRICKSQLTSLKVKSLRNSLHLVDLPLKHRETS